MEQVLKELPGNIVTGSAEKEAYMCMLDTLTHNPEANEKYGSRLLKKRSSRPHVRCRKPDREITNAVITRAARSIRNRFRLQEVSFRKRSYVFLETA